jgi:hypothetical protein
MKIPIPFDFPEIPQTIMRRAGYASFNDPNTGITSYTKRFSRGDFYPRFHVYPEERDNQWTLNIHLDQKRPSYEGAHAHSGDYDGPVVEQEAQRIEQVMEQLRAAHKPTPTAGQKSSGIFSRLFSND